MLYRADLLKEDGQLDEAIAHLEAHQSFVVDQLSWKMKMAELTLSLGMFGKGNRPRPPPPSALLLSPARKSGFAFLVAGESPAAAPIPLSAMHILAASRSHWATTPTAKWP